MKRIVLDWSLGLVALFLRLAFVFVTVIAFCRIATAQGVDVKSYFEKLSKSVVFSCESPAVYEYKGEVSFAPTDAHEVKVDLNGCKHVLMPTIGIHLLEPLLNVLQDSTTDNSGKSIELTQEQQEKQRHEVELNDKKVSEEIRTRTKSLFETCQKQGVSLRKSQNKLCYFGAPSADSGAAFKDAFEAMAKNTLPNFRSLCAPDPIMQTTKIEHEFRRIRKSRAGPISWNEVRQSIEDDGFVCRLLNSKV